MNKLLIVVDFQNDFIDGALGFDGAIDIKDAIMEKIKHFKTNNYDVVYTLDTHEDNYLETEEGDNLPVIHCVKGTHGHQVQKDVKDVLDDDDLAFVKYSFPALELGNYLKDKDYDEIELCGLVSNICVISNAVIAKSALPDAHIVVDAQATASFDERLHEQSLNVMEGLHIEVKNR
ncbi:MAG: cysteine hydrolase [Candidatus Izimaplasma sp.]|nr:cysteine hydrolase [Candidatus Izimaplasma bacterium]